jgi:geranylgeranylglycerol-phosphate geranylgeranyltransferase
MASLSVYFEILRPSNVGLFFMAILLGAFVVVGPEAFLSPKLWLAAISGTLIGSAANVINDVMDIETDKINKPNRPLIRGAMTIAEAKQYWMILNILGLITALYISMIATGIAIISILIMYAYSVYFKRQLLIGNLVVCFVVSLGLVYGAIAMNRFEGIWFPIAFSFLFNFAREVLKDLEDVKGDEVLGAKTLALLLGQKKTLMIISGVFIALIMFSLVPYLTGLYGIWYIISVMAFTNSIILFVVIEVWRKRTKENFYRLNTILKYAMLTGIISIALGRV